MKGEHLDSEEIAVIAWSFPASHESIGRVLSATPDDDDGRSQFVWLRLENGDLFLAVAPRGATYEECELDAQLPAYLRVR